jgi:cell division initiation protein
VLVKYTPLDIRHQEFSNSLSGYSKREVREFLTHIADQAEEYERELRAQHDRIAQLEQQVGELREGEEMLRRAVVSAERIAGEMRLSAEREVKLMRETAENEAMSVKRQAAIDADNMRQRVETDMASYQQKVTSELEAMRQSTENETSTLRNTTVRDSGQMVAEAEAAKEKLLRDALQKAREIRSDIEQLRKERDLFASQFKAMLQSYLTSIEHNERGNHPI